MAYAPYRRAAILIPVNDIPHLFVVLNDPCEDGQCLLVMVSSIKPNKFHDDACTLTKGDHEFIKVQSYVVYRIAETALASHISNMVEKKFYTCKSDVSEELFERIADGLYSSEETRPSMLKYAKSNGI